MGFEKEKACFDTYSGGKDETKTKARFYIIFKIPQGNSYNGNTLHANPLSTFVEHSTYPRLKRQTSLLSLIPPPVHRGNQEAKVHETRN